MPNVGKIVKGVVKAVKGSKKVKVSSNVTVKAPKGKTISSAEEARLKAINKTKAKLKPKYQSGADKANAKALKASGKVKPRTDTKYERFKPNSFEMETLTARELAREKAAQNALKIKRGY